MSKLENLTQSDIFHWYPFKKQFCMKVYWILHIFIFFMYFEPHLLQFFFIILYMYIKLSLLKNVSKLEIAHVYSLNTIQYVKLFIPRISNNSFTGCMFLKHNSSYILLFIKRPFHYHQKFSFKANRSLSHKDQEKTTLAADFAGWKFLGTHISPRSLHLYLMAVAGDFLSFEERSWCYVYVVCFRIFTFTFLQFWLMIELDLSSKLSVILFFVHILFNHFFYFVELRKWSFTKPHRPGIAPSFFIFSDTIKFY